MTGKPCIESDRQVGEIKHITTGAEDIILGKIKSESIVNEFKKCAVSNNMDESEDDILWKDSSYKSYSSNSMEDEL